MAFLSRKAEELISFLGRTVTGRGRIIKLDTCNRMCWFKLGLEINTTKPGEMSMTRESSHSNPVKGVKRKKKKKKNPKDNVLAKPRGVSEDGL